MTNHGGKRAGAGRKPDPHKKVPLSTKICPQVRAYLREQSNQAETIENAIRRSKAFREWCKR